MFLYQLVNLVLETCFIFSKTLKLSKTFSSWVFSSCSIIRTTSVMIPLFQIFGTKMFKKMLILECLGVLQSQLWCPSWIFFDTSLSRKMFELLTCKKNHNFSESRASCGELFYLKEFETWQVCEMLSDIFLCGVFTLLLQLPRLVAMFWSI